jgi:hypothetical protein
MPTDVIVAFLTGVIGPVSLMLIKHYLDKKQKPDMVKDALKVSELVNHRIEQIRDEYNADRVWILQFHNGGHFYPTGKSMAKFSFIYEVVSSYASSIQLNYQNIPVNIFGKSINHLLENDSIDISDFNNDTTDTYGLKVAAESHGCKSVYLFAIKTIDNKFIGVIGLDYTKKKTKLDTSKINELKLHATAIGGVLMKHLNN